MDDLPFKINMLFWTVFAISSAATFLLKRAQASSWQNGIDKKVSGGVIIRTVDSRNKNVFFEIVVGFLFFVDIASFLAGVCSIPAY